MCFGSKPIASFNEIIYVCLHQRKKKIEIDSSAGTQIHICIHTLTLNTLLFTLGLKNGSGRSVM